MLTAAGLVLVEPKVEDRRAKTHNSLGHLMEWEDLLAKARRES